MQLDTDPTRALAVIVLTARCQILGNPPDALRLSLNDSHTTQCFQPPDVGVDDVVGVVPGIRARQKLRTMLGGLVGAFLADGRNVAVRGPWWRGSHFDDAPDRKLAEVHRPKGHVVSPSVDAVD